MDISMNARVNCSDGSCGQCTLVILKPATEEITNLVVASRDAFPETEYLVSIRHVMDSSTGQICLDCSREDLSRMVVFDRLPLAPPLLNGYVGSPFMIWPVYPVQTSTTPLGKNQIPPDELAIQRGARVEAVDGYIGQVDEFLVDPVTDRITHLIMREGHLWGQKDVTIPVIHIDHYQGNTLFLNLNKQAIENIPGVSLRSRHSKPG